MISAIFNAILYRPLYNGLVALTALVPGGDIGIAIILLTLIVRVILTPLSHKSVTMQSKMRMIEGHVKQIRIDHAEDKELQAKKIMELYKEHGINPFSSFLLLLVQLPILIALYWVIRAGFPFRA